MHTDYAIVRNSGASPVDSLRILLRAGDGSAPLLGNENRRPGIVATAACPRFVNQKLLRCNYLRTSAVTPGSSSLRKGVAGKPS